MSPRNLFTGILILILFLTSCTNSTPTLPPLTATTTSLPLTETSLPPTLTDTPTAVPATETPTPAPVVIPDPAGYTWAQVVTGLNNPVDISGAQDGSNRLFVLEQPGRIRILKSDQLSPDPFLDIVDRVGSDGSEQGLLGIAFHPNFAQNGFFYVNYTDKNGDTHIARFTASGDIADPASEKQLLFVDQPYRNHNGGAMKFGPDGYLYIGLGDGGSAGDPQGNAQSLNTLLGKVLRIDVDNGDPYAIPPDNPFASGSSALPEIWAFGLRNPWRIAFDRANGDFWTGDVGQNNWEEIDFVPAGSPGGLNFGWDPMEGTHPFEGSDQPQYTAPVAEYDHSLGCSVTGGFVYRGETLPEWQGIYLFGDYCSGIIWGMPGTGGAAKILFESGFRISTFGEDDAGELYVTDYGGGTVYRLSKP